MNPKAPPVYVENYPWGPDEPDDSDEEEAPNPLDELLRAGLTGALMGLGVYLSGQLIKGKEPQPRIFGWPPAPASPKKPKKKSARARAVRAAREACAARAKAQSPEPPPPPPPPYVDRDEMEDARAAALLNLDVNASEDEIRERFRAIVREKLRAGGFGDQGGDAAETVRYTSAKNRMVERARQRAKRA